MPLDQSFIDSVANANLKNVAEAPAFYSALAMGDAVSHQRAVNTIREAALGQIVKSMTELDPVEALSVLKGLTGQDLAQSIASLLAALASSQQQAKVAQTTPPPTA